MKKYSILIFLLIVNLYSCIHEKEIKFPDYNFTSQAHFNLEYENALDSIYIYSYHWNHIPGEEVKTDSFLVVGSGIKLMDLNVIGFILIKIKEKEEC